MSDEPLSYWVTVARQGFENDFNRIFDELGLSRIELAERMKATPAYVSKVLNGSSGNFQLLTMVKWARAIDAILQIRLIKEGSEVVRVVDYETARLLEQGSSPNKASVSPQDSAIAKVVNIDDHRPLRGSRGDRIVTAEIPEGFVGVGNG